MAKIIEYPRASLRAALQLAEAVDGFAGSCSAELAAEKLGKKISGAFSAQIASAAKYGLIDNKGGKLTVCPLYRNYKLAYTPEEATKILREALLCPPLFRLIYNKFKGQKLPVEHFEKMLIKEFEVPDDMASRVCSYFLDGAKQSALLNSDNVLVTEEETGSTDTEEEDIAPALVSIPVAAPHGTSYDQILNESKQRAVTAIGITKEDFWLNIRGPGVNFSIEIKDIDDLDIVHSMLKKIEKALKTSENIMS